MMLSKLIEGLQKALDKNGDMPVLTSTYSDRDNKDIFDDFEGSDDWVYKLKENDGHEEYIGENPNVYGSVVVISHGEY